MNWEVIGVLVGVVALVVAVQTYHRQFNVPPPVFPEPEPIAEKDNLKAHFKMAQKLALEVQDLIQQHVDKGNGNKLMYPEATFQQFLKLQKTEFEKCLSDELYENIDKLPLNKYHIDSMVKSLQTQATALQMVKNQMQLIMLQQATELSAHDISFCIYENQEHLKPIINKIIKSYDGDLDIIETKDGTIYNVIFLSNSSFEDFKREITKLVPDISFS